VRRTIQEKLFEKKWITQIANDLKAEFLENHVRVNKSHINLFKQTFNLLNEYIEQWQLDHKNQPA
jgi:hypothetical protein